MSQELPAPSALQPSTMDFPALMAKAMAMPDEPQVPAAPAAVAPAPTGEPAVPSAPPQTPPVAAAPAPTPKVLELDDDLMVKVKVDGVEQLVSVKDYRDGIQREAAFTRRTQALAEQRREAEQALAAQLAEITKREEALKLANAALAQQTTPLQKLLEMAAPKPATPDPTELATIGDIEQRLQALREQATATATVSQADIDAKLQQAAQQLKDELALDADRKRFNASLESLLAQPDLAVIKDVIPFPEDALRFQVVQLDPQTMDQAIEYAQNVAKEWAAKISAVQTSALKQQEIARARQTMEPPTGSAPAPTPSVKPASALKKTGGVDWEALRARANAIANAV